ncbi:DUF805 domain-containing protein [Porphyromonas sp. COT-290 OH3588]|uniref:DUF805 domain-containing protein n=1 Tax=Porphyromonas sp. COT-290 OH3588 TaxID=1515617 RepID=UPI00052BF34C|nr:DUF805 domain-containing protein [Porphyromonas sp. COT-290 OH3588]KGN98924.1 hypothetical protein HQ48_07240 [Porphyromonas sp. COT-290 OH3588]
MKKSLLSYFKECYMVNYINPRGRARRREFWGFQLFYAVILVLLLFAGLLLWGPHEDEAWVSGTTQTPLGSSNPLQMSLAIVFSLISLPPFLTLCMRRLHDINRSGWWATPILIVGAIWGVLMLFSLTTTSSEHSMLLIWGNAVVGIASIVVALIFIVFFLMSGTRGANRYGQDPKALHATNSEPN